ncbi:asparagine synthase (glutamine-hydrolyzing) [Micromonospora sp. NPDC049175]|uniref:asparagine synthase (glutamine-hydrolyzing) n=1 Tax=Micromonospora sp. NPDC049175 TaxID=3364266 RepID=UPI003716D4B9
MCGVTGWVDWDRDLRCEVTLVEAMTETLYRRGPDDGGVWLSQHAALGHRRLAIIDLAGGVQPMVARGAAGEPRAVITYSGEVYNYRDLRAELVARGHYFRTASDTEVVLAGYLEWGAGVAERLLGIFAFAIWDAGSEELLLVRDRLGVKPLYYAATPDNLLFGSEPKAVLANPLFEREIDAEGIAELFAVPTAPTPGHAVYRGLREVLPGHTVTFGRQGVRENRYWTLSSDPHTDDLPTTVRTVRELLEEAVRSQLVSDVPLGSLLSGGLDSSAVTALAAQYSPDKLATFAVDFPENEGAEVLGAWNSTSDSPYAALVAEHVGTQHTRIVVPSTELLQHRSIGLAARDRPGWGEPDVSLYLLFRGVRAHSTVALTGEVADEIFGGYPYFHSPAVTGAFPWTAGKTAPAGLLRDEVRAEVRPDQYAADRLHEALAAVPELPGEATEDARIRRISYLALTRWLPAMLDRKDRMSMATGLEARVPFADHRLVEYLWNVPWALKNAGGRPKGLLRQATADLLPDEVVNRPKSGYPASAGTAYGDRLRLELADLLHRGGPVFDLVDPAKVEALVHRGMPLPGPRAAPHPTGGADFLLAVNSWLQDWKVRIR